MSRFQQDYGKCPTCSEHHQLTLVDLPGKMDSFYDTKDWWTQILLPCMLDETTISLKLIYGSYYPWSRYKDNQLCIQCTCCSPKHEFYREDWSPEWIGYEMVIRFLDRYECCLNHQYLEKGICPTSLSYCLRINPRKH